MRKIRFIDRELKSLSYTASTGPTKERPELSYNLNVSEAVAGAKDSATVAVEANLTAGKPTKAKDEKEAGEPAPFMRLEMTLKFDIKKLTKAERANLKKYAEVFEAYAGSLCAEVVQGVLMNTPYRIPNFPR